ncbi:superoxide dismutase [Bizionia gelidisalsuginis]|uniref:Superoxide dismutase n=2 Tax=Bizionia gelidisalsuginis TaxID=291188 RepID=A0ABY3M8Q8_9FLAO|nr:superoxide dismutase [Bizionia gelidisalsuginis]
MVVSVGAYIVPSILLSACKSELKKDKIMKTSSIATSPFKLPELSYGYDAFPDVIDPLTMEIHYTKHHQGYTDKLNAALEAADISGNTIKEILRMKDLPDALRNNGGGYYNHNLYWDVLTPGGKMTDSFKTKISEDFGSEEAFLNELADAGAKRFGSGWAWVVQDDDKKLRIFSTPNQDNPLMEVSDVSGTPILGIDVWEHAYYLKYQNKRTEYLRKILNIINWNKVEGRMI